MRSRPLESGSSLLRLGACAVLAALASGVPGCSDEPRYGPELQVNVVYDPSVDFSEYRSFAFRANLEADDELLNTLRPELQRDLWQANALLAADLLDLGLSQVDADDADVLAFSLARTSGTRYIEWRCVAGAWGGYWYWWGYSYDPCAWLEPVYADVDTTTLMLGLLDPARERVVFAGFVSGVDQGAGPDSRDRDIASGVARVMARYPGRPSRADARAPDGEADGGDGGVLVDAAGPSLATR